MVSCTSTLQQHPTSPFGAVTSLHSCCTKIVQSPSCSSWKPSRALHAAALSICGKQHRFRSSGWIARLDSPTSSTASGSPVGSPDAHPSGRQGKSSSRHIHFLFDFMTTSLELKNVRLVVGRPDAVLGDGDQQARLTREHHRE